MNKKKGKKKNQSNIYETKNKSTQNENNVKDMNEEQVEKENLAKEEVVKENTVKENIAKQNTVKEEKKVSANAQRAVSKTAPKTALRKAPAKNSKSTGVLLRSILKDKNISQDQAKAMAVSGLKILLPIAACVLVIFVIVSALHAKGIKGGSSDSDANRAQLTDEPLQENAYDDVNELMNSYFKALADGDMDTIVALSDYNDDTTLITYEKRSEFIDEYLNVTCYTKPGLEENSYFVYVSYDTKVTGIDTMAPGLNAFHVYTAEDGSLKIDGDMEENVEAAFKLVTNQDDVVDLYNRIDVKYKEAVLADEALNTFMEELPDKVKRSVGVALAQIEGQNDELATDEQNNEETQTVQTKPETEEQPQNQAVNQLVRATDTVNVRKSDSEEADRIGKVSPGTELTRIEERINGWSKVIYEGSEAYIKSDYLEVISTETVGAVIGSVKAKTNVNVRSAASQESEKLGVAQADTSYELLEDVGEWYRIKYNGMTGYVKAEFFE